MHWWEIPVRDLDDVNHSSPRRANRLGELDLINYAEEQGTQNSVTSHLCGNLPAGRAPLSATLIVAHHCVASGLAPLAVLIPDG